MGIVKFCSFLVLCVSSNFVLFCLFCCFWPSSVYLLLFRVHPNQNN
jgi:hypothetical protein